LIARPRKFSLRGVSLKRMSSGGQMFCDFRLLFALQFAQCPSQCDFSRPGLLKQLGALGLQPECITDIAVADPHDLGRNDAPTDLWIRAVRGLGH